MQFLRLIRWGNLLMIAVAMFALGIYFDEVISSEITSPLYRSLPFILLVFAVVLIAAGGNVINDIFDREIDAINRPEKRIIENKISVSTGIKMYFILTLLALVLAFYLGIYHQLWSLTAWIVVAGFVLWMYAQSWKKKIGISNIIIGLLTGIVPVIVGLFYVQQVELTHFVVRYPFEIPFANYFLMYIAIGFGFFAFLINWSREIVKDIQDIKGDEIGKVNTIPLRYGEKKARRLASILLGIVLLFAIPIVLFIQQGKLIGIGFYPLLLSGFFVINAILSLVGKHDNKASFSMKIALVFGLILPLYWTFM